jgi:hypothetical protein
LNIEKQPPAVKEKASHWASEQGVKLVGEPYAFSINISSGTEKIDVPGFGNQYASFTLPIPAGIENLDRIAAVMLKDGKYVPRTFIL